MNAISMSVSVSVSDPKDLVLVHAAVERLMVELNSINSMSVQKPIVVVDPATGFAPKANMSDGEIAAVALAVQPKIKRVRSAKQLAHDAILREQSIARHLALGHIIKAGLDTPAKKSSKKAPAAEQGLLKRPTHIAQSEIHPAPKPTKKQVVVIAKDEDVPEGFEHPVLVETHYAYGDVKVTKDMAKKIPAKKSSKRVIEVPVVGKLSKKQTIKVSDIGNRKGHKVVAASPAE